MSQHKQDIVRQPPFAPPPKPQKDQKHWCQRIQETVISALPEGEFGITLSGGADNGQFCCLSELKLAQLTFHNGKLYVDDIVLEIQGQKIAGYTLRDATIWLKQVAQNGAPMMVKTVKIGLLPRDLKQYLAARFQKGSVDHDLQQTIRDNLYLRTVPCTTRKPRPKEKNGVDYSFLSIQEFEQLEKDGRLLESGVYGGNHYGTPKPPHEPKGPLLRRSGSVGQVAPDKRKRTRSQTDSGSTKSSPVPFNEEFMSRKKSLERAHSASNLGPLPRNWEMAYTDDGHPYFIDHDTETTHWLDPRLANLCKQTAIDCDDDELPFGWEKVEDPHYGTYYIDHVNRRTQYENPVAQAKRTQGNDLNSTLPRTKKSQDTAKRSTSDSNMNHRGAPPEYNQHGRALRAPKDPKRVFTKNPDELKGEILYTSLVKSIRGFGFTIIGGNQSDEEFLQIKKVVENGPAYLDGVLQTGDVLIYVDDKCVLGYSHQDIVNLFQTIQPLQKVSLSICRGYLLPFDSNDPNTEIIVTVAVTVPSGDTPSKQSPPSYKFHLEKHPHSNMNFTSANNPKSLPDLTRSVKSNSNNSLHGSGSSIHNDNTPDVLDSSSKVETLTMHIVRGEMGFGFTIADSAFGQRVKQILDKPRCKDLQESDILQEINGINVKDMSHGQIVQVLKESPKGVETKIVVQRGGVPLRSRKPSSNAPKSEGNTSDTSFSSNPGAFFFNEDKNSLDHNRFINGGIDHQSKENYDTVDGSKPVVPSRPKTPNQSDSRPKTPVLTERPKTPTRTISNDDRGKPPIGNRHTEMFNTRNDLRRDHDDTRDSGSQGQDLNQSRSSSEFHDINTRPPPGPRFDQYRIDQKPFGVRPDTFSRSNSAVQHKFYDTNNEREVTKPGMFRSRTPGPDMLHRGQGPDYRGDSQRPKTPTAQDMRSKTPLPGSSFGYNDRGNPDFMQGHRYQNNTFGMNGPSRQGFNSQQQQRQWGFNNYPGSPPVARRGGDDYQDPYRNNFNSFSQKGAGHPSRQSTSFEDVDPTPSNLTRVPKRLPLQSNSSFNSQYSGSPRLPPRVGNHEDAIRVEEYSVTLNRQDTGFGFRIIGGTEEGSQVSVGHIVPGGAADLDGRVRTGDEITHVDGISVINSTHQRVVLLMTNAGSSGRVTLGLRRRILVSGDTSYNGMSEVYDITVNRRETEGFGFVIISSVTKSGSVIGEFIGRILENSPAERCGRLHVGDRILAVNGVDISYMHHEEIVNLIKEAGYTVTLTIGIPQDDTSSTTSNSQKGSQGSMVNAMAYPTSNDSDVRRYPPPPVPVDKMKDINRHRNMTNHQHSDDEEYLVVELHRGSRGFGFSIRGGTEFNSMPLFVLRIAEGGSADLDHRLRVGDQILEINGYRTDNMSHSDAIDVIQNGGTTVRLLIKRTGKLPPSFESNPVSNRYERSTVPMSNGPIGQSSPYLGRRTIDPRDEQQFYSYGRQYNY